MSRRRWLVAYDIANDRRRQEVNDIVVAHGWRMQYSVYLCNLTKSEQITMKAALRAEISHDADQVVFIDLGDAKSDMPHVDYVGLTPPLLGDGQPFVV